MKYALTYGLISGLVIIAVIMAGLLLGPEGGVTHSYWFGYSVMLVALTFIFVGVKRYRDIECGGVIRFLPALGMGLAIATVAALAYIVVWEVYLASTGYRFMDEYIASMMRAREAAGATQAQIAAELAEMEGMREAYRNPLIRVGFTFLEIFPVGLLVALVSAALLRNPKLLPATEPRR